MKPLLIADVPFLLRYPPFAAAVIPVADVAPLAQCSLRRVCAPRIQISGTAAALHDFSEEFLALSLVSRLILGGESPWPLTKESTPASQTHNEQSYIYPQVPI